MAKKLRLHKPKLLIHHYVDIGMQACSNILIIAFLVCIIIYIKELNNTNLVEKSSNDSSDNSKIIHTSDFHKTMQRFINIMAWIMLCVIGLSSFISVI